MTSFKITVKTDGTYFPQLASMWAIISINNNTLNFSSNSCSNWTVI